MIKSIQLYVVLFLLSPSMVVAGTIVEILNDNQLTTILTDGQHARMNMSANEYVIVDYKSHQVRIINPEKQEIMLLDANKMPAGSSGPDLRTQLKQRGAGNNVAGYATQKYEYSANGKSCGFIHGSKNAYQVNGVKQLFSAMQMLIERQWAILGGLAGMLDVCTLADMKMTDHVNNIGVPMRTEKNGRVDMEVKSIKTNVAIPGNAFVIPASYRTISLQDKINGVAQAMPTMQQKMQQHQPQIQEMMRQMQQSGQVSPEVMEQMRRAQ